MSSPEYSYAYAVPVPSAPAANLGAPVATPCYSYLEAPSDSAPTLSEDVYKALAEQGYTRGLAEALMVNLKFFPLRIWVVDNSGSMMMQDGHRVVESRKQSEVRLVPCTRWAELQQTVVYHAQMAAMLGAPTEFWLLNDPGRAWGPQQFSVAERGKQNVDHELAVAQSTIINSSPNGLTPLTRHLHDIHAKILALEPQLRLSGAKVVVVLATDGMPTDDAGNASQLARQEFQRALNALQKLPVWLVVRLCTDDNDTVGFYNEMDGQLEMGLEVLDDFTAEAAEVHALNPWLNYGLPLHRMREMGFHERVFDLLDECKLPLGELRHFFLVLFGRSKLDGVPDPQADKKGFVKALQTILASEKKQWNPITKRMEPWVDLAKLKREYRLGSSLFG